MKPQEIASYRLVRNFGGSSSTFLVEGPDGKGLSVLKTFPGDMIDADAWGEICSQFRSQPNPSGPVCWLDEVGLQGGRVYAVAPYLKGETLAQVIKAVNQHRSLTREPSHHHAVAVIMAEICAGVLARGTDDFSHPVFDRDMVTPAELFVLQDGSVAVLDARWSWLRVRTSGSPWSSLERNLAYMAPAARHGERRADAGRSWALGVMLWELLAGYRLFRRNTLESTLHAVAGSEIPDPRVINSAVPDALALLVMRTLTTPGALGLHEFRGQLLAWLGGASSDDQALVKAWKERLFPDDVPTVVVRDVDANGPASEPLVSDNWSAVEESTTCISVAPSLQQGDMVQLSWLEGEAAPRISVKSFIDEPSSSNRISTIPPSSDRASIPYSRMPRRAARAFGAAALLALLAVGVWGSSSRLAAPTLLHTHEATFRPKLAVIDTPTFTLTGSKDDPPADTASLEPISAGSLSLDEIPLRADEAMDQRVATDRVASPTEASRSGHVAAANSEWVTPVDTGVLLVRTPAGSVVTLGGVALGEGTFRVRLPAGQHTLRVRGPTGTVTYTAVQVRAGTLGIVETS